MKCYEMTRCSEKDRAGCYVWKNFSEHPEDMEDLNCWVIKGTYHEKNQDQSKKCKKCKYYCTLNSQSGVMAHQESDIARISCTGYINLDKTEALSKVWEALKKNKKNKVMFDISNVNNIYSCGLSLLIKMHNEANAAGGMLVIVGGRDHLHQVLHSSKLSRILHLAPEPESAREIFNAAARKKEDAQRQAFEAARIAQEEARKADEAAKPKPVAKRFVRCWEYWQGHNPNNATTCNECFQRQNPKAHACWVVEGLVEGVTFHFVNEACLDCAYFEEFGSVPQA